MDALHEQATFSEGKNGIAKSPYMMSLQCYNLIILYFFLNFLKPTDDLIPLARIETEQLLVHP